jgi:hypothetical protein
MTQCFLKVMSSNGRALSAPVTSTTPFGSYVAGTRFYLDNNRSHQISDVHHGVKVSGARMIVMTRLVLNDAARNATDPVPCPSSKKS